MQNEGEPNIVDNEQREEDKEKGSETKDEKEDKGEGHTPEDWNTALTGIQHISHPVLYVFQGELMRMKQSVRELRNVRNYMTNYGKLYGLYTHSKSAVVHVATLNCPTLRQLEMSVYRRLEHAPNEYDLNCVGEWLTSQNVDIPVLEILRKKAAGLSEGETCFLYRC